MTISEFIEKYGISATAERTTANPNTVSDVLTDEKWMREARHWIVTLRRDGQEMQVPFSQGSAYTEPPTAEDVLDCLASDAAGVDGRTFEEWADDYGYDTDSRKAERTYRACVEQTIALKTFLGMEMLLGQETHEEAYEELISEVERL